VLSAQETSRFTFNLGAGFTTPVGATSQRLDTGWNIDGGAGVNINSVVGVMLQANYSEMGIGSNTLSNLGFAGGGVHTASFTLNPIVHLNPRGKVDVYLIGGGGLYHRTQEFTQPGLASFVGFDPFFGFYTADVPVEQVVASYTVNKPGLNGGLGLSFGGWRNAKFYAEARYHRIFITGDRHTDYVPVTFGIRF
jgi:hypothetical protein